MSVKMERSWYAQSVRMKGTQLRSKKKRGCRSGASGNKLADGDTVTLIKDLKVKGAPKDLGKQRYAREKYPYR